ncbi:MAG TPA: histidine kinase, partial [Dehalococcoidia bacterium]|nr:histidine kinase [Dehalococcoidia bacterium]
VRQLRVIAGTIAQGRLDSPVQIAAQDEVGELAEDIETMRGQLARFRDDLEQAKQALERQVRERTQRLHETLGKVITAQEEERRRLARELHDEQGQALGAISISLDRLSRLVGPAFPQVQKEIEQARDMARLLLQETRRLIYDLRPSVLDDMGLEAAIRWSAETHLERHGVEVTFNSSLPPGRLSPPVEVALFRVAQEAITNIERHAQARHAGIVLEQQGSSLLMQVRDDGRGFDARHILNGRETGVGLEGMQERVLLIGGHMEVVSVPGKGTLIKVEVPLD